MAAHDRGTTKLDSYLCRVLAAIIKNTKGGELRVKGADVDLIDEKIILTKDWNAETQEIVFRVGSSFCEVFRINPEAPSQWTNQQTSPIRPSSPASASAEATPVNANQTKEADQKLASTIRTNEELAKLEADMRRRQIIRMMRQEKEATRQESLFHVKP